LGKKTYKCEKCGQKIDEQDDARNKGLCDKCSREQLEQDIRDNGLDW
jgi:DNA-directed RNA polymerase subunit RPC12/RpoP